MQNFNELLLGKKVTTLIENNHLAYMLASAKLDACGHPWLASLM
jgi:hypothetical protein